MWILRFHLLSSKDYNKLGRICQKYGFVSRTHSVTVYAKASVKYMTGKYSWRTLSREFHIDHSALSKFYTFSRESGLLEEIFHVFLESRIALYIGDTQSISTYDLDHSQEIYELTQKQIVSMI